jgi:pimeloyl-ACP methyl ester carboxylesterase
MGSSLISRPARSRPRSSRALLATQASGAGDTLVLIHGLATTSRIWSAVTPALARRRRVVTVDLPGFGGSAPAGPGFDLAGVAERIARGLAAQGVRGPFDLVGHSLGAAVALTLAAGRPRSVRRLILVAPAGLTPVPWPAGVVLPAVVPALHAVRRRAAPVAAWTWGRRLLLAFTAADAGDLTPTQARLIIDGSAAATRTAAALNTVTTTDLRPELHRAGSVPLALLWGGADRTIPVAGAGAILRARPDARLEIIEHGGHVVMLERPAEFVAALERLLGPVSQSLNNSGAGAH